MFRSTLASVAASINHEFDARADVLAWINDSSDNTAANYPGPSWDADSFDPSPEDWQDYAEWSRSLDGGCGVAELTPDEKDLLCGSMTQAEWIAYCEAEYDSFADCEADRYAEMWT